MNISKQHRQLPDEFKQSMMRLKFREPCDVGKVGEFYRIRLRAEHKADGEGKAYRPYSFQPETVGRRRCMKCKSTCKRIDQWFITCQNRDCDYWGKAISIAPKRGVIKILVPQTYKGQQNIVEIDGVKHCLRIVLVLDRRYSEKTLDAVFRTAKAVGELTGLEILG